MLTFDTKTFLQEQCGGPDGVLALLGDAEFVLPQREAIRKWFERGSIAGDWWPLLLLAIEFRDGKKPEIYRYLQGNVFD